MPRCRADLTGASRRMLDRRGITLDSALCALCRYRHNAHWAGAKHRLAREFGKRFGDNVYAAEELVAELTSAYLCAELGIPGKFRHPEYLASWIQVLRADARALFTAGAKASQAAEY